jgi:hypothetical protein
MGDITPVKKSSPNAVAQGAEDRAEWKKSGIVLRENVIAG